MTLCPPAAAISSARLAKAWLLTSQKSPGTAPEGALSPGRQTGSSAAPLIQSRVSMRLPAARHSNPLRAASAAFSRGTITAPRAPPFLSDKSMGSTPTTGLRVPSSASSPMNTEVSRRPADSFFTLPQAASMPRAMGRSKWVPVFLTSAGARLTVILFTGKSKPEFLTAATTRSFDSLMPVSGRPTTE